MEAFHIIISIVGACIPSIIWLFFFLPEDEHPEPKRLLFLTFGAGAFVSLFVLVVQYVFQQTLVATYQNFILLIVGLAVIEEVFKFFAAHWTVEHDPNFNEPVDGMIYMIVAALGFATVENLFVISSSFSIISTATIEIIVSTLILRFIGATLLHILASGIVGYYWAKGKMKHSVFVSVTFGIIIATFVHSVFNYLISEFQDANLLIYPSIFLITAVFFVLVDFEKLKFDEEKGSSLTSEPKP